LNKRVITKIIGVSLFIVGISHAILSGVIALYSEWTPPPKPEGVISWMIFPDPDFKLHCFIDGFRWSIIIIVVGYVLFFLSWLGEK